MSRETFLNGEVAVFGLEIYSPNELQSRIDDATKELENVKLRIHEVCAATPKDLFPDDTYFELNSLLSDLFEEYEEVHSTLVKLYLIESNKDCLTKEE